MTTTAAAPAALVLDASIARHWLAINCAFNSIASAAFYIGQASRDGLSPPVWNEPKRDLDGFIPMSCGRLDGKSYRWA